MASISLDLLLSLPFHPPDSVGFEPVWNVLLHWFPTILVISKALDQFPTHVWYKQGNSLSMDEAEWTSVRRCCSVLFLIYKMGIITPSSLLCYTIFFHFLYHILGFRWQILYYVNMCKYIYNICNMYVNTM